MPSKLKQKALFYHKLHALVRAGIPLAECLRNQAVLSNAPTELRNLKGTLTAAMRRNKKDFDPLEIGIIEIGETSGKLEECTKKLADWYNTLANARSEVISGLLYPAVILHLAPPLLALPDLVISGSFADFATSVFKYLAPIYIVVGLIVYGIPMLRRIIGSSVDAIALKIPVIGRLVNSLSLSRYTLSLAYAIDAGLDMHSSLRLARNTVSNGELVKKLSEVERKVKQGSNLFESFSSFSRSDELLQSFIKVGEQAGSQVEMLLSLHRYYYEDFTTLLKRCLVILPTIIFLIVAYLVGSSIIEQWSNTLQRF